MKVKSNGKFFFKVMKKINLEEFCHDLNEKLVTIANASLWKILYEKLTIVTIRK